MISPLRIALVTCKHTYSYDYAKKCNNLARFENLAVGYLAAVLEQRGFAPDVFSYPLQGFSRRALVSALRRGKYQLVGFSVNSANLLEAIRAAEALPSGTHCCFGGYAASLAPEDLLANKCVDP
ncbi:MAG: hypothetical protein NTY38_25125, partial [Acidobacteria bacterium]|nr:hypothetical protein [Acidobacteriota bacterium]